MREISVRDEDRNGPIRNLRVGVVRTHDAVNVADHDRANLKRAKLAMTTSRMIISVGFDLDKSG